MIANHRLLNQLQVPPWYLNVLRKLPWGSTGRVGFYVPGVVGDCWIELPVDEPDPGLLLLLCTKQGLDAHWTLMQTDGSLERGAKIQQGSAYGADWVIAPPPIPGRSGIQIHPMFRAADWKSLTPTDAVPDLAAIPVTITRPDGGKPASRGCAAIVRECTLGKSGGGVNDPYGIWNLPFFQKNGPKQASVPAAELFGLEAYPGSSIIERALAYRSRA